MQGNKHKPLILQDYLTFYSGGCTDNLTISQLKKILSIHGFTQLGNSSKEDIIEAVRSLHMTPPVRTTTSTNSVPLISLHAAALSVREVTRDMQVIGWEECPVQSVKTIEPKVPAMSPSLSFVRPVPQTNANLKEKDNGALSICELPSLKFSKKARTVVKKRADKCSWRFSGCMNISGVPYKRSRNDERSDLQSSVGEEGANKYVKELRYYKCSEIGCFAKKHIDRDANDPSICTVTYKGQHNHAIP
ncbi:WRKY transcription factor 42-like isoform X3 [Carex rostrata]